MIFIYEYIFSTQVFIKIRKIKFSEYRLARKFSKHRISSFFWVIFEDFFFIRLFIFSLLDVAECFHYRSVSFFKVLYLFFHAHDLLHFL
jgi:hypothetical protein